jgi:hypothetical protein
MAIVVHAKRLNAFSAHELQVHLQRAALARDNSGFSANICHLFFLVVRYAIRMAFRTLDHFAIQTYMPAPGLPETGRRVVRASVGPTRPQRGGGDLIEGQLALWISAS